MSRKLADRADAAPGRMRYGPGLGGKVEEELSFCAMLAEEGERRPIRREREKTKVRKRIKRK